MPPDGGQGTVRLLFSVPFSIVWLLEGPVPMRYNSLIDFIIQRYFIQRYFILNRLPLCLLLQIVHVHPGSVLLPARSEILAYKCAKNTCSGSMQDTYTAYPDKYGIINEISYGLNGFVTSHASHIDILLEVQLLFVHAILRFTADKSCLRRIESACKHRCVPADLLSHWFSSVRT